MRAWVISSSYPRSPGESVNAGVLARDLALTLAERGIDVMVVTPTKPGGVSFDSALSGVDFGWYRPSHEISDISSRPVDLIRGLSLVGNGLRAVRRLQRSHPPDFVIALWALPSAIFARHVARSLGIPYGVWLLGSDVWRAAEIPAGRRVLASVCREADVVAADGTVLGTQAMALTGVDVGFLPSARRLPKPFEGDFSQTDLVFVGRYHRNKGPDLLLRALGTQTNLEGLQCDLYGAGELLSDLAAEAQARPGTAVHQPISAAALGARLESCRALVIPSRVESVPLILGDAVQARCQVVVADVGDMAGIVRKFDLGTVFEPENPAALASSVQDLFASTAVPDWEGASRFLSPDAAADYFLTRLAAADHGTFPDNEPGGRAQ